MSTTYNTHLPDKKGRKHTPCHLPIEDGTLIAIEDDHAPNGIDFSQYVVLPSLANAHTHLGDAFAKEATLRLTPTQAVGRNGKKWQLLKEKDSKLQRQTIAETLRFQLQTGTTLCADFREEGQQGASLLKQVAKNTPMHVIILGRGDAKKDIHGWGLNVYSEEELPAKRNGKLLAIHAGEAPGEIEKALAMNPDIIVHATLATSEEIAKIAANNIGVIICPRANAALGVGHPPVRGLLDAGVTVALGTDNAMINQPNLWREMDYLLKTSMLHGAVTAEEVYTMATRNGRTILGRRGGVLEPGAPADLIFIEKNAPNLRHSHDPLATLITRTEPENVRKVMVAGEIVVDKDTK